MRPFEFTDLTLDRQSNKRKCKQWLDEQLRHSSTEIFFVWRSRFIFKGQNLLKVNYAHVESLKLDTFISDTIFLGARHAEGKNALFVADVSVLDEADLAVLFTHEVQAIPLRACLSKVTGQQSSEMAYGSALASWLRSSQYCGHCGSKNNTENGGHSRICSNSTCAKPSFPRTDPVVIMLVDYQPDVGPAMCLLAQHTRSENRVVSTLAGFVDPGETLEQAVMREVQEETGVSAHSVQYVDSQPWPFPNSLMIGFRASTHCTDINIDDDEIESAYWFTAEQVRGFDEWGDEGDNFKLPRKESISRFLIEQWLAEQP